MIDTRDTNRRLVIPRWLKFSASLKAGELSILRKSSFELNRKTIRSLRDEYADFVENPSPQRAADLMGAAFVVDEMEMSRDLARYVKRCGDVNIAALKLADGILNINSQDLIIPKIEVEISKVKSFLSDYNKNALGWIHLGRLYTIKGQFDKARKAVFTAVGLAPNDRYILRSAVRFFLHIKEKDAASFYINRAAKYSHDPWLKATEVNVAILFGKGIGSFKKLIPHNLSRDQIFQYSELIESHGILELNSGNVSRAKKSFRLAWSHPSQNVVRHGEWILRNELPGLKESTGLDFSASSEAMSWMYFYDLKLDEAIRHISEWELEEPYSAGPNLLGSYVACCLDDPRTAAEFAIRGLFANPNDSTLKNNLCYALSMSGDITNAEKVSKGIPSNIEGVSSIVFNATRGYLEYKKSNIPFGRSLYLSVLKKCEELDDKKMYMRALLCMAIAEVEANCSDKESKALVDKAMKSSERVEVPEIILIRNQLRKRINKLK